MTRSSRNPRVRAPEPASHPGQGRAAGAVVEGPRVAAQRARLAAAFGAEPAAAGVHRQVVQMVRAGRYATLKSAHLRSAALQSLKTLAAGSLVQVEPDAPTRRFALHRLISQEKDHTWVSHDSLQGWLRDEVLGSPQPDLAPQPPTLATVPAAAAPHARTEPMAMRSSPLRIGGGSARSGDDARSSRPTDAHDDAVASSLVDLLERFPALPKLDITAAKHKRFEGLHVYVHFTKPEYRKGIHTQGLQPGKSKGIGLPSDEGRGPGDKEHVYVLSKSADAKTRAAVGSEAGDAPVAVLSRSGAHDRDVNYPQGAHRFLGAIAPGRASGAAGAPANISLVLPLSPQGRAGLAAFVNQDVNDPALRMTPGEAEVLLAKELFRQHPLRFLSYRDL